MKGVELDRVHPPRSTLAGSKPTFPSNRLQGEPDSSDLSPDLSDALNSLRTDPKPPANPFISRSKPAARKKRLGERLKPPSFLASQYSYFLREGQGKEGTSDDSLSEDIDLRSELDSVRQEEQQLMAKLKQRTADLQAEWLSSLPSSLSSSLVSSSSTM